MKIPSQTADIFDYLSKGQYICSNSSQPEIRKLYDVLDENETDLYAYFQAIGFGLERGDEYFYFSRRESRADLERKLSQTFKWIDILDFLKAFDNAFGSGYRFSVHEILVRLSLDAVLKIKLAGLKRYFKEEKHEDILKKMVELMKKDGFIELENEISGSYKTLASFKYLEQLIMSIHIPEEIKNEIPE